jgi:hypothetical protein
MDVNDANELLNPLGFAAFGTVLGAGLNKIFSIKEKNHWYWLFYIFAVVCVICLIWTLVATKGEVLGFFWYFTLISTVILVLVTAYVLKTKNQYQSAELDPVVNSFTEKADKQFINLLCGDVNFFGTHPTEMDKNSQYNFLRSAGFTQICIMCYPPRTSSDRIRYGKLLTDLPQTEIRYYHPNNANLSLRGRITKHQGIDKLLMYFKISGKTYQAIETDTSTASGALYRGIWNLIWDLGSKPTDNEVKEFKEIANS